MKKKRPKDWSAQEKYETLMVYESLNEEEKGAFVRAKGLHAAELERWKEEFLQSYMKTNTKGKKHDLKDKRIRELEKELNKKDKALAETAALLALKKKADLIWGDGEEDT